MPKETLVTKHKNLLKHLELRLVFLSFLVEDDPKLWRKYEFITYLQLIATIIWTCRYIYFLTNSPDDILNYYLSDANYMLGTARNTINIIFICLYSCFINCVILWKLTPVLQQNSYQYWLKGCEVFETECFRGIGKFTIELKIIYYFRYILIVTILVICIGQDVKLFSELPFKFSFYCSAVFFFFYHSLIAYMAFFYLGETIIIFMFQLYLYSEYFVHLNNSIYNESSPSLIEKYLAAHLDMLGLFKFNGQKNYCQFIGLVSVQVILCYYIFFTDILLGVKIALALIFLSIHPVGITAPFITGAILQDKHEKLINQLFTLATRPGPVREKLTLLNLLEHCGDKTEVPLLGEMKFGSKHYLLILLESASILLLLIANLGK
ncbi:uncharacterized protein LOC141857119 [Brevipalpus obovatus]|uniref:uncharacterized protein LOC141857119 n=1 Tax=Brevipalpus obovatus TaxID=246614 RepID=UPI003D9E5F96